ncbi:YcxB family protein [Simiduia curdlanivorans]|uniref:YcxB family protein n=1 Tax=Simiduia curdlanivorans TaxID=1492769 RepID=A0ABV8V4V4_9GAMM|nr:YcxB family protein [Simiduia curdlanivorans]MDN3640591.1 YcxB family protein [Simiduia curdlanivorans]
MIREFTVSADDFRTYSRFAFLRLSNRKAKGVRSFAVNFVVWFVVAIVFFTIFQFDDFSLSKFHWPSGLAMAFPFVIFVFAYINNLKEIERKSMPNEDGLMLGKRKIEFNESGITDSNRFGVSVYKWEALQGVEQYQGNVYLSLDTMLAQIFPASSFESSVDRESFVEYINTCMINHSNPA